jgi:hypothetical protein
MNAARRSEIRDDVAREIELATRAHNHLCQIAQPTPGAPLCLEPAVWSSDDVKPGRTIWMCDACAQQVLMDTENVRLVGVFDDE